MGRTGGGFETRRDWDETMCGAPLLSHQYYAGIILFFTQLCADQVFISLQLFVQISAQYYLHFLA